MKWGPYELSLLHEKDFEHFMLHCSRKIINIRDKFGGTKLWMERK